MSKNLTALLVFYLLLGAVVVTSFQSSSAKRADFTFVNDTEPQTLDPGKMTGQPEGRLAQAIFEGLTIYHPKTLEPLPGVAKSWDISPDGRTYTFTLRDDSFWVRRKRVGKDFVAEKLRAVTAQDFLYSWRRVLEPETASEYYFLLFYIEGAEAYRNWVNKARDDLFKQVASAENRVVSSLSDLTQEQKDKHLQERLVQFDKIVKIKAKSETELELRLIAPTPYFLDLTSFYPMSPVNRECVEAETSDRTWTHPESLVSNGPFYVTDWMFNYRIRLQRNEHYWDVENVAMATVDALAVEDTTTAINLYSTGVVDWIPQVPLAIIPELKKMKDDYHNYFMFGTYFYRCNTKREPFIGDKGLKVRQALSLAIDRENLLGNVTRGGELPAHSIVPGGLQNYKYPKTLSTGTYQQDLAKAKKLLAEAGYPDGKNFPKLTLLYNTSARHKQIATAIQAYWKSGLNVDIELVNQEWGSYLATVTSTNFQVARAAWIGDYMDPATFLDMWVTDGPQNNTNWSDPRYDRLIVYSQDIRSALMNMSPNKAITKAQFVQDLPNLEAQVNQYLLEKDAAKQLKQGIALRAAVLAEAGKIFAEQIPAIPIYFYTTNEMWNKDLEGMHSNLRDTHLLKFLRWKNKN